MIEQKNGSCNEIVEKLKEEMLDLTKEKDKLKEVLQNQHHYRSNRSRYSRIA